MSYGSGSGVLGMRGFADSSALRPGFNFMCLSIQVNHPARVLSTGIHAGFEFVTVENGMGFRCGYIRVPAGHPWHGKEEEIECEIHGGLTFSGPDKACGKNGADDAWWIGFDCAHYGDARDPDLPANYFIPFQTEGTVRTQDFVESQCRRLCEQAAGQA